jgi:C-terminal processing protease CtpA/Prc
MNNLFSYHKKIAGKRDDVNIVSRKLNGYFGTALAKELIGNNLQVNSVISNTLADQIGLKKGDLITKFAWYRPSTVEKTPAQVLNAYLKGRTFGDKVALEVTRNGQSLELSGEYVPVVVPEAYYTVDKKFNSGVINQSHLSSSLTYQFDQLLLAINKALLALIVGLN